VNTEADPERRRRLALVRAVCQVAIDHLDHSDPDQAEMVERFQEICSRVDADLERLAQGS
jgi:hypothetical protein